MRIFSQELEYKGGQWPTPSYNSAPAAPWAWVWAASWCSSWCHQSPACSTPSWGAPVPGPWCGHQRCWQMSGLRKREMIQFIFYTMSDLIKGTRFSFTWTLLYIPFKTIWEFADFICSSLTLYNTDWTRIEQEPLGRELRRLAKMISKTHLTFFLHQL